MAKRNDEVQDDLQRLRDRVLRLATRVTNAEGSARRLVTLEDRVRSLERLAARIDSLETTLNLRTSAYGKAEDALRDRRLDRLEKRVSDLEGQEDVDPLLSRHYYVTRAGALADSALGKTIEFVDTTSARWRGELIEIHHYGDGPVGLTITTTRRASTVSKIIGLERDHEVKVYD